MLLPLWRMTVTARGNAPQEGTHVTHVAQRKDRVVTRRRDVDDVAQRRVNTVSRRSMGMGHEAVATVWSKAETWGAWLKAEVRGGQSITAVAGRPVDCTCWVGSSLSSRCCDHYVGHKIDMRLCTNAQIAKLQAPYVAHHWFSE